MPQYFIDRLVIFHQLVESLQPDLEETLNSTTSFCWLDVEEDLHYDIIYVFALSFNNLSKVIYIICDLITIIHMLLTRQDQLST